MVLVFPLALIVFEWPWPVWPRYFVVNGLFALVLAARGLSLLAGSGKVGKAVAALALAGFVIGNALLLDSFHGAGRGQYGQALDVIAAGSPAPVTVAGYPEFSVATLVAHHARSRGLEGTVRFSALAEDAGPPADWFHRRPFRPPSGETGDLQHPGAVRGGRLPPGRGFSPLGPVGGDLGALPAPGMTPGENMAAAGFGLFRTRILSLVPPPFEPNDPGVRALTYLTSPPGFATLRSDVSFLI